MRRPNREINIFSMSVIDLFASALGAFIVLTIALIPSIVNRTKDEGFPVPLKLAVSIDWVGAGVDLDLYVVHSNDLACFEEQLRQRRWGSLMRDERTAKSEKNKEVFFIADFVEPREGIPIGSEGTYEVRVAYYPHKNRTFAEEAFFVRGKLVFHPGDKLREQTKEFSLNVSKSDTWAIPGAGLSASNRSKLACRFELVKKAGGSYDLKMSE